MNKNYIFAKMATCCLISGLAFSQKVDANKVHMEKVNFLQKAESMKKVYGYNRPSEFYFNQKININKTEELKSVGLNLKALEDRRYIRINYKEESLFYPKIIIGKILSKEYDTDINSMFHTKYKVVVLKSAKGGLETGKEINIYTRSGLYMKNNEEYYLSDSNENFDLILGSELMMYLDDFIGTKDPKEVELYKPKVIKIDNNGYMPRKIYQVKNNMLFNEYGKKESTVEAALNIVNKINNINQTF